MVLSLACTTALLSAFLDNLTTILLDRAGDLPAGRRPRHRPDPADRHRGDLLEHRRHRDADRRSAEHHHRRRHRPQLQQLHRQPGADRGAHLRRSVTGLLYFYYRPRLQVKERNRRYVMELDAARLDPRRSGAPPHGPGPRSHDPRLLRPSGARTSSRRPWRSRGRPWRCWSPESTLEQALSKIEWPTLFFFVALFVMVGALEVTGAIGQVADAVKDLTGGDRTAELMGMIWIAGSGRRSSTTSPSRRR